MRLNASPEGRAEEAGQRGDDAASLHRLFSRSFGTGALRKIFHGSSWD
jgi:hypothetical protein